MKQCSKCKQDKPLSEFTYNIKTSSYSVACTACNFRNKKSGKSIHSHEVKHLSKVNDPR
jgi:hypothetical protein